jgi:ribosome-binding protein aMBF1 (putative translation factor)
MPRKHRFHSAALRYTYDRYVGNNPARQLAFEEALVDAEVSLMIYELRTSAGLTQAALANRMGTTASVISRLEDADYRGHSLAMLRRIATALGRRVEIRFVAPKASRMRRRASRKRAVA